MTDKKQCMDCKHCKGRPSDNSMRMFGVTEAIVCAYQVNGQFIRRHPWICRRFADKVTGIKYKEL